MAWVRKYFKGKQKVWVEVDEEGGFSLDEDGLVPIRYTNEDDAKTYNAHPSNIGGDASSGKKASSGTKTSSTAVSLEDAPGDRYTSDEVPEELVGEPLPAEGIVEIYTDGACQGNPGPCSYGLLIRSGPYYREMSQYLGQGTNNIGELMAIFVGLESVTKRDVPVRVHTDSSYAIGVLSKGWKAKANRELIDAIKQEMTDFDDLTFVKVKGHAGIPLNERADTLAVHAIERARGANLV